MNWFTMYLFLELDTIYQGGMLLIVVILLIGVYRSFRKVLEVSEGKDTKLFNKRYRKFELFVFSVIFVAQLAVLLPNKEQLFLIYAIPKLSHNEQLGKMNETAWKYLNNWLNGRIREMKLVTNLSGNCCCDICSD